MRGSVAAADWQTTADGLPRSFRTHHHSQLYNTIFGR